MAAAAVLACGAAFLHVPCLAWDGYDWDKGVHIEIEKGNLVRTGHEIEIYDWGEGTWKDVEVLGIRNDGSSVELEVQDGDESGCLKWTNKTKESV